MITVIALTALTTIIAVAAIIDAWAGNDPARRQRLRDLLGCPGCGTQRCTCYADEEGSE